MLDRQQHEDAIKQRLKDHFGGVKLSYQGSQFRKFIFQICQNDYVDKFTANYFELFKIKFIFILF